MTPTLSAAAVAIGRSLVLSTLVKVTLCFAIGLLAARLLRRSRASLRHAAGGVLMAARQARGTRHLARLRRFALPWPAMSARARDLADARGPRSIEVLRHDDVPAPITFGILRPVIVLPHSAGTWPDADVDRVLVHELEHVRRRDWIVHMVARAACAIYWFHPLAWSSWRRLGLEAERACDDAVVAGHEETSSARQLVDLASRLPAMSDAAGLGVAHRSDLSARVDSLLGELLHLLRTYGAVDGGDFDHRVWGSEDPAGSVAEAVATAEA